MTTTECIKACQSLSVRHSFIATETAHLHIDSYDGSNHLIMRRSISVFETDKMVHFSQEQPTFSEALASVHAFFQTLTTHEHEPVKI
jgi:hypothetical protein